MENLHEESYANQMAGNDRPKRLHCPPQAGRDPTALKRCATETRPSIVHKLRTQTNSGSTFRHQIPSPKKKRLRIDVNSQIQVTAIPKFVLSRSGDSLLQMNDLADVFPKKQ
jgi:hypothetical protein